MRSNYSPFEQRLRTSARIALYGSMTLALLMGVGLLPLSRSTIEAYDDSWYRVDYESLPEVKRFQEILRIDTTPSGSEVELAELLGETLEQAGLEVHIERMPDRKANLWATLEGEDRSALVLHSHLDTEPIFDEAAWRHPPLSGTIEKPWIYGRGAFDMKSVTTAQIEAVLAVARRAQEEGRKPKRSLIFLATSSEEVGSELGTVRIIEEQPELASRFWAVITEGGVLEARDRGNIKYWGTSFAQKHFVQVHACSSSRERLEHFVADMREHGVSLPAERVISEVRTFLDSYAGSRDHPNHRRKLSNPDKLLVDYQAFDSLPPYLQALFRNEAAVFPLEELPDGSFRVRVSLHLLPGADLAQAKEELLPSWITHGLDLQTMEPPAAQGGSDWPHPLTKTIEQAVRERFGDVRQGPYFLSFYANDSRFFRNLGIPSYGFTPFPVLASDSLTISRADERIAVPEFVEGVELYREVLLRLMGFEGSSRTPGNKSERKF